MIDDEFKSIDMMKNDFKPNVVDEIDVLLRNNDGSDEFEISHLNQEQRENYCNHILRNICQMVENVEEPPSNDEIQECIKKLTILADNNTFISDEIFFKVVFYASKINSLEREDCIYNFKVSSFKQNPSLIYKYFRKEKGNIHYFIDEFSNLLSQSQYDFWIYIINSSQEICNQLIYYGILDKIITGIILRQDCLYWMHSLQLLDEIAKNCSTDMTILIPISKTCFKFLDANYPINLILQSVKCLITITLKIEGRDSIEDKKFCASIMKYKRLRFLDQLLCENKSLEVVQPIMNLISNISTKFDKIFDEIDLYKNKFIQHLIELSSDWDKDEFGPIFQLLFPMLTFTLRYHQKLIIEITKSNLLDLAIYYLNDAPYSMKYEIVLFFSRLCDDFFWEYVSDFFEKNSEIVSSLFLMLPSNITKKSILCITHALTSLAINIKEKKNFMPNMVSQYTLQLSIDAYNAVRETDDVQILAECNLLNQAVNNLIQDIE